jgi:uncharacterized protein (TIGR00304 family)
LYDLVWIGIMFMLVGFVVIFAAFLSSDGEGRKEVRGGGVVMVGPIPIIFGSDAKWASIAILLAIILVVLTILLYVV